MTGGVTGGPGVGGALPPFLRRIDIPTRVSQGWAHMLVGRRVSVMNETDAMQKRGIKLLLLNWESTNSYISQLLVND